MSRTRGNPARPPLARRAPAATTLASVVLLALAACGDVAGTEDASEVETWADDVCVAVAQWQGELAMARATISDVANLSAAAVQDAVESVTTATEELAGDLERLEAPETEAGSRARDELTSLSAALDEQRQVLVDATAGSPSGLDELRDQASAAAGALRSMVRQTQETVQELRDLDGAEELSQAFADAPGCRQGG